MSYDRCECDFGSILRHRRFRRWRTVVRFSRNDARGGTHRARRFSSRRRRYNKRRGGRASSSFVLATHPNSNTTRLRDRLSRRVHQPANVCLLAASDAALPQPTLVRRRRQSVELLAERSNLRVFRLHSRHARALRASRLLGVRGVHFAEHAGPVLLPRLDARFKRAQTRRHRVGVFAQGRRRGSRRRLRRFLRTRLTRLTVARHARLASVVASARHPRTLGGSRPRLHRERALRGRIGPRAFRRRRRPARRTTLVRKRLPGRLHSRRRGFRARRAAARRRLRERRTFFRDGP